ncbi:hypothetical protein [Phaeodactylibacter sp.]|jgi:hypothetical protein|uniref:hypothetical protein n=1 Tax=Phaeodactylibacter sp. TaxID=1940289 RepID=UPI0025DF60EA|nr:hypothetical protein [Phaeodactylibacter sp.]MCI4646577.1 hypothetical protein [Phaeodactylibacter sp.]MCI5094617.1 hypothetical protein [Phaeodactylibacter sp.]
MSRRQVFGVSLLLFVLHQLLQKGLSIHLPFFHAYLDPFLSMPIVLGLLDWERTRRYGWRPLIPWEIAVVALLFVFLFECGFPLWNPAFTADWWDVPAYGAGALVYGSSRPHAQV